MKPLTYHDLEMVRNAGFSPCLSPDAGTPARVGYMARWGDVLTLRDIVTELTDPQFEAAVRLERDLLETITITDRATLERDAMEWVTESAQQNPNPPFRGTLTRDDGHTNDKQADWGRAIVGKAEVLFNQDANDETASDLIACVLHWAHREGYDPIHVCRSGEHHFRYESGAYLSHYGPALLPDGTEPKGETEA